MIDILKKILSQIREKPETFPEFAPYYKRLLKAFLETYPDQNVYKSEEFVTKSLAQGKHLLGGQSIEKYSPIEYCDSVNKIIKCVETASESNSKSTKRKALTMLEKMILDNRMFVEMGNGTYAQVFKKDKAFFERVDMSKRQELVNKILPILNDLNERLYRNFLPYLRVNNKPKSGSLESLYYYEGIFLYQNGKFNEAISTFQKATALNPKFAWAYCNFAVVLDELGRHDEALVAIDKAISIDPNDSLFLENRKTFLANMARKQG